MGLPIHLKVVFTTAFSTCIAAACPGCKAVTELKVRTDGLKEWQGRVFVQHALPELNYEERELLLTGFCESCWDDMWAYLKDEYDDFPEPRLTENGGQA